MVGGVAGVVWTEYVQCVGESVAIFFLVTMSPSVLSVIGHLYGTRLLAFSHCRVVDLFRCFELG